MPQARPHSYHSYLLGLPVIPAMATFDMGNGKLPSLNALNPETEVVEIPTWLMSVYTKWQERNKDPQISPKLPFSSFMATRDDLVKLGRRVDQEVRNLLHDNQGLREEMTKMRLEHARVITDLRTVFRSEADAIRKVQVQGQVQGQGQFQDQGQVQDQVQGQVQGQAQGQELKEPRSQEAFDVVRKVIYTFNKRNVKRVRQGQKPLKFGANLEYSEISDKESLVAWLDSDFAKAHGFGNVIEEFEVCVFRGELATISPEFKGGVGIEAFWIPDDKYDTYLTRSTCYESANSLLKDPRHGYMLNGVKWVPSPPTNKRKSP